MVDTRPLIHLIAPLLVPPRRDPGARDGNNYRRTQHPSWSVRHRTRSIAVFALSLTLRRRLGKVSSSSWQQMLWQRDVRADELLQLLSPLSAPLAQQHELGGGSL